MFKCVVFWYVFFELFFFCFFIWFVLCWLVCLVFRRVKFLFVDGEYEFFVIILVV